MLTKEQIKERLELTASKFDGDGDYTGWAETAINDYWLMLDAMGVDSLRITDGSNGDDSHIDGLYVEDYFKTSIQIPDPFDSDDASNNETCLDVTVEFFFNLQSLPKATVEVVRLVEAS